MYLHMYIYMHTYVYIYIHISIYIHTYLYIHIHLYIHMCVCHYIGIHALVEAGFDVVVFLGFVFVLRPFTSKGLAF